MAGTASTWRSSETRAATTCIKMYGIMEAVPPALTIVYATSLLTNNNFKDFFFVAIKT
jgi:hypothetical protein